MLDRVHTAIKTGDVQGLARRFFGGGGGGFGVRPPFDRWVERPGESAAPRREASEGEGQQAGEEGAEPQMGQSTLQDLFRLLRPPGARGGGRFNLTYGTYNPAGGRGQGEMVETGDYLVTLKAGEHTRSQVLRVISTTGESGGRFLAGEEER